MTRHFSVGSCSSIRLAVVARAIESGVNQRRPPDSLGGSPPPCPSHGLGSRGQTGEMDQLRYKVDWALSLADNLSVVLVGDQLGHALIVAVQPAEHPPSSCPPHCLPR